MVSDFVLAIVCVHIYICHMYDDAPCACLDLTVLPRFPRQ